MIGNGLLVTTFDRSDNGKVPYLESAHRDQFFKHIKQDSTVLLKEIFLVIFYELINLDFAFLRRALSALTFIFN